jgi:hypothetical protein
MLNEGLPSKEGGVPSPHDLPQYPKNEVDILETWEERFHALKALSESISFRSKFCTLHIVPAPPIRLDQFSSPGELLPGRSQMSDD